MTSYCVVTLVISDSLVLLLFFPELLMPRMEPVEPGLCSQPGGKVGTVIVPTLSHPPEETWSREGRRSKARRPRAAPGMLLGAVCLEYLLTCLHFLFCICKMRLIKPIG